jgi:RNA-binding protein Luc7-like 2
VDVDRVPELAEISKQIEDLVKAAESAGENGEVAKSMKLMEEADALRKKKAEKQARLLIESAADPAAAATGDGTTIRASVRNSQKLRVCDICSSLLSLLDSDDRLAEHFGGRIHLGWAAIRNKLQALREARSKAGPGAGPYPGGAGGSGAGAGGTHGAGGSSFDRDRYPRDFEGDRDRYPRDRPSSYGGRGGGGGDRDWGRDRGDRGDRDWGRDRDRDRAGGGRRDYRDRSRSRSRDRDRDGRRSRSR